ncbi:MAG: hypothetical protein NT076_00405 [Candidatus Pacearchaeota archaeon]|nr:hypothetical protein [Candidatus Pacearchaeota archaeon]
MEIKKYTAEEILLGIQLPKLTQLKSLRNEVSYYQQNENRRKNE